MKDDESAALTIETAQCRSEVDELGRCDWSAGEGHRFEPDLASAALPTAVVQESPEEDPAGPGRKRCRLLELSESLMHPAEGVAHQGVGLSRTSCERARKWKQLDGEAL
jgi:hypothetical protein